MKSESASGDTPHEGENPREDARPSRSRSVEMFLEWQALPAWRSIFPISRGLPRTRRHYDSNEFVYEQFQSSATRGLGPVPVDEIRQPVRQPAVRRSGDFEMQIRLACIAGSADARRHLATPHAVPCLHAQTSRLQMQVVGKLAATKVEGDWERAVVRKLVRCNSYMT